MKIVIATMLAFFVVQYASAQTTPQEITRKFFELYKKGDTDQSLDFLFSNAPYANEIADGIEDVKRQLKKQTAQMGKYYGAELLTTRTAGPNVIMFTYLVRYDKQPLTFNIMYYKPDNKWQMQSFKYDSSISDELEEASKIGRLKENFE